MGEASDHKKAQTVREAVDSAAANERDRRLKSGESGVPSHQELSNQYRSAVVNDEKKRERK